MGLVQKMSSYRTPKLPSILAPVAFFKRYISVDNVVLCKSGVSLVCYLFQRNVKTLLCFSEEASGFSFFIRP